MNIDTVTIEKPLETKTPTTPAALAVFTARPCAVCGSNDTRVKYPAKLPVAADNRLIHYQYADNATSNTWHYKIVQCKKCGHHFSGEIFDQETIEKSYLMQDHDNEFGLDPVLLAQTNLGYVRQVAPYLSKTRDFQLDVGCDTGIFLRAGTPLATGCRFVST